MINTKFRIGLLLKNETAGRERGGHPGDGEEKQGVLSLKNM